MNGDWPNLFSEKLGSLRAPFVIVFKRMAEASAHSSGVRDVVCEDQSCEKNSAPSALSSLESVVDVDVSTGKNVSYADAGRPEREEPVAYFVDEENEVPQRPCTAFVNPRTRLSATDVFEALKLSDVDPKQISCIQRQSNGEIQLTFRNAKQRELFLKKNVIQIRGQPFALQDVDRPLTYLQIFDSPYKLPDSTIINCLAKYCDVLHHRRGYFREPGFEHIQDGVRHYRVRIKNPIPNFLRFGKIQLNLRYEGQPRTCRHCNQTGHYANACHNIVCYNCEQLGHLASDCPEPPMCNLCKSTNHKARACQFSWARDTRETSDPESESVTEETPEKTATDDPEELPMTEECDGLLTGQPDTEDNNNSDTQDKFVDVPESDDTVSNKPTDSAELFLSTSTEETLYSLTPAQRKQPAKPTETIIPGRIPTKPVLVTGTGVKNNLDKMNSGEPLPKRSRPNKKRYKDCK